MKRILLVQFVATLALLSVCLETTMLGGEDTSKTFTVVFPAQLDDGTKVKFNATECWVTFEEAVPTGINYPKGQALTEYATRAAELMVIGKGKKVTGVGRLQIYFYEGELEPGKSIKFKAKLINGKNYLVDNIEFGAFDNMGRFQKVVVSTKTNKNAFKLSDVGFTNHEYFDFSNPNNGMFTLINDPVGDGTSSFEYTLTNFRIYTNLPESNYDLNDFDNVGTSAPVYATPSLVVGPNQTVSFSLGQVGPPGQGYAVVIADQTTVTQLDTGLQTTANGLAVGSDGNVEEPKPVFNVAVSDPVYDSSNQAWDVTVTTTNVSGATVDGPFTVLIAGLHSDIRLLNGTGIVGPGPYLELPGVISLTAGASVTDTLQFSDPNGYAIIFQPQVFIGSFQ